MDELTDPRERAEADAAPAEQAAGAVSQALVEGVTAAVAAKDAGKVRALVGDLHEADLADLIEALAPELRAPLVLLLGDDFDFATLTELDETVRVQILEELPARQVAEGVRELDSDDAVYILEDLDQEDRDAILAEIPAVDRAALKRSLDYPEELAGRRMQSDFIAVPPFWTVGQTIDYMRDATELPDEFYEIFVIDPAFHLLGVVPLNRLLRTKRPTKIGDIMSDTLHKVGAADDQEDVARLFERYNLVSAAVVDDDDRLVGVLTVDDMIDVIQEEADEDIRRLAGVGDEEISDTIGYIARSRLPWLLVNMLTGFVAASVIGFFDGSIQEMVALAALMPIVASMGGNAGTQAMTVTVRALATRDLGRRNVRRIVVREIVVGLLNGSVIALVVGIAAGLWFSDPQLGVIIGVALVVNMLTAGLAGVLVPLALTRLKVDPAVASGVFVTTVTDVVGFFAFLGLASWWFALPR